MMASALMMAGVVSAAVVQTQGEQVTIRPDGGQAKGAASETGLADDCAADGTCQEFLYRE